MAIEPSKTRTAPPLADIISISRGSAASGTVTTGDKSFGQYFRVDEHRGLVGTSRPGMETYFRDRPTSAGITGLTPVDPNDPKECALILKINEAALACMDEALRTISNKK